MHELKMTDLDHVSGGLAPTLEPSRSDLATEANTPPDTNAPLHTTPPFRGGPVHRPHD